MFSRAAFALGAVLLSFPAVGRAGLSTNLFHGDFESVATLKNEYSYDSQNNPIGAHRFNSDPTTGDWGKWLGFWGPPSYCFNGYCGQGGFSTWDNPRDPADPRPLTMTDRDLGNNNRSLDPYNPSSGNHVMETIAFYPTMTQWVKAPANQVAGPMQLKFDFFYNNWDPSVLHDRFEITVYGSDFEPPHNIGITWSPVSGGYDLGIGSAVRPTGGATQVNYTDPNTQAVYQSKVLGRFGWGDWWTADVGDPETGGWAHVNSAAPGQWWDDVDAGDLGSVIVPLNLTQTWDYYSVTISTNVYSEDHYFYWGVAGYGITTEPTIGFDNVDFRVSVGGPRKGDANHDYFVNDADKNIFFSALINRMTTGVWDANLDCNEDGRLTIDDYFAFLPILTNSPDILKADTNLDGLVNALDISSFIQAVTNGDSPAWAEADTNRDISINALDISGFVSCLTGGTCGGAAGASVPEPAAALVLLMGVAAMTARKKGEFNMLRITSSLLLALLIPSLSYAALSSNLIVNGNFQSVSGIKTLDSPRTQAEINAGAQPVRAWQFHPGGIAAENAGGYTIGQQFSDFGKWIGAWGISTNADPRALYNQTGDNGAPNNVSTVAGNSFLEGTRFRSWAAQVVKAPQNHVAGTATINFDYYFNQWTAAIPPISNDANSIFHVWVGGINDEDLPTWADRAGPIWGGNVYGNPGATSPGAWDTLNPLWSSPNWDSQPWGWGGIGSDQPAVGSQGQLWHTFSAAFPNSVTFNIPQPYDNYYVSIWQTVYSEAHEYNWLYDGKVVDELAVAIDNVNFRVSVGLVGDCNLDGAVNALDISCFVGCLTGGSWCGGECDVNGDGVCNALDIAPFISCLTGGACGGEAEGEVVPEPAGVAALSLVLLTALRRRR